MGWYKNCNQNSFCGKNNFQKIIGSFHLTDRTKHQVFGIMAVFIKHVSFSEKSTIKQELTINSLFIVINSMVLRLRRDLVICDKFYTKNDCSDLVRYLIVQIQSITINEMTALISNTNRFFGLDIRSLLSFLMNDRRICIKTRQLRQYIYKFIFIIAKIEVKIMKRRKTLNFRNSNHNSEVGSQFLGKSIKQNHQQQQSDYKQDKEMLSQFNLAKQNQQRKQQLQSPNMNPQFSQKERTNSLLTCPPSFNSKIFKNNISELLDSFNSINKLTEKLQYKVDHLLKRQQNQFIASYNQHMLKIDQQFRKMEMKTERMQEQIEYYENEGIMSTLIQKIKKIEQQNAALLYKIGLQAKQINSSRLENTVLKDQLKRTQKRIKQISKNKLMQFLTPQKKNQQLFNIYFQQQSNSKIANELTKQQSNLFTTEINIEGQQTLEKIEAKRRILPWQIGKSVTNPFATNNYSLKNNKMKNANRLQSLKQISMHKQFRTDAIQKSSKHLQQSNKVSDLNQFKSISIRKEMEKLKRKNQALVRQHSQIFERKLQMQAFLTKCVDEIKRNVRSRKKIRFCTFQDFSKQDKVNLLLKIVSNQEILRHLYQKIFKQKRIHGQENLNQRETIF